MVFARHFEAAESRRPIEDIHIGIKANLTEPNARSDFAPFSLLPA
jgi:hypothetical protein